MNIRLKNRHLQIEDVFRWLTYAFLILLVVWRIPFLNKGIDYTDTGYNMANYKNFFDDLSSNGIGMFLTNLIGAVIYNILPSHQLLVFRVMHWVMWTGTYLLIFFTFRQKEHGFFNVIFSGLLLIVSSYQKIGEAMYSYYPFSMLLVAVAMYLMYTAVLKDKKIRLVISGLVLGINVGARLPNLLFFSLVACVFWYYLCKKQYKKGFARSGWMLLGIGIGTAVTLITEFAVIGAGAVTSSAGAYSNLASSSSQDHGIINQILHIFMQAYYAMFRIVKYVFPIILTAFVFTVIYRIVLKKYMSKPACKALAYVVIFALACVWFGVIVKDKFNTTTFLHVFGLISLFFALVSVFVLMRRKPELSFASTMVIVSSACIIVGTDLGITRFTDVLPQLCVTLVICSLYVFPAIGKEDSKFRYFTGVYFNRIAKVTFSVVLGLSFIISAFTMVPQTYNDSNFLELDTEPANEIVALRGMKTTPERAESINNLYFAMTENESVKDKEVAVIGMFPLLFNIVDNDNYFNTPCIDYNSVSVAGLQRRYEAKKAEGIYPVIVISRLHMHQNGLSDYCDDMDKKALIESMLSDCEYELIFTDINFDVYIPIED